MIGGLSVDPVYAAEQMHLVKDLWFQSGGCQLRHFVICLDERESSHVTSAASLEVGAYDVCEYYAEEYQIVFGIHFNDNRWDIHFVMNNVSFMTGKRYSAKNILDYDLRDHILTCLLPTDRMMVYYD